MTTPSVALTPVNENFQGIPVRIVSPERGDMIPVVDIARALGMNRGNLSRLLKKQQAYFKEHTGIVKLTTPKGAQDLVCITEFGAIGLLYKIDAGDSAEDEITKKILAFQNWATELIQKKMQVQTKIPDNDIMQHAPSGVVGDSLRHHFTAARVVAAEMGVPLDLAMAKALVQASRETGVDLTGYARLLPARSNMEDGEYITPTEIARIMGPCFNAYRINYFLYNMGYQVKSDDDGYKLTAKGEAYGKEFPYAAGSGHVGYSIRWKREVMKDSGMIK